VVTGPVGAVVTGADGAIVAEGRGRRFESAAPPGQLAWTGVAHAELNALARLGPDRHYTDHALLTTLEPCAMCRGAAIQASVGSSPRPASRSPSPRPLPPLNSRQPGTDPPRKRHECHTHAVIAT